MYQHNRVNQDGAADLFENQYIPMFTTKIRKATAVDEITFNGTPILLHAPRSTTAQDYLAMVEEYLMMCQ